MIRLLNRSYYQTEIKETFVSHNINVYLVYKVFNNVTRITETCPDLIPNKHSDKANKMKKKNYDVPTKKIHQNWFKRQI